MAIRRLSILSLFLFLLIGCTASTIGVGNTDENRAGSATAAIARDSENDAAENLDLEIVQTAAPPIIGNQDSVDVQYTFEVKNLSAEPVKVNRITIWSAGGAYQVESRSRPFKKTIAPGTTEKFPFWVRAINVSHLSGTNAPITLRTELQVEDSQGARKAAFVRTVGGHLSIGVSGEQ